MKKLLTIAVIMSFIFLSCTSKPRSLSDQLETNLLSHLNKIDSAVVLDSFEIIRIDTVNERLGRIIGDTLYKMELHRVEAQLDHASKEKRADSVEFYQGEVNYMVPQIDSLAKSISTGDTTKTFGLLIVCRIQIRKNTEKRSTRLFYFLDEHMTIQNSERIDDIISPLIREMNGTK
jgi:hypothetical protein